MLRLLADENLHSAITRGLLRANPALDLVRAQDVDLSGVDDPAILSWAADEGRVLVTHDAETVIGFAYDRVRGGLPMPGIIEVRQDVPIGKAIEDLLLLAACSDAGEWEGQVLYVPLR